MVFAICGGVLVLLLIANKVFLKNAMTSMQCQNYVIALDTLFPHKRFGLGESTNTFLF